MDKDKAGYKYRFGSHDGSDQAGFTIFEGKEAKKLTEEKEKAQGGTRLDVLSHDTIDCEEGVGQEAHGHQNI